MMTAGGSEGRTGAAQEEREDGGSQGLATLVRHRCTPHLALAGTAGKLGGLPLATVSHKLHCRQEPFHCDRLHTLQQATAQHCHKAKRLSSQLVHAISQHHL